MTNKDFMNSLKHVAWCLACSLIFCGNARAEVELVDRIVAVVNNEIISLFELEQVFEPYAEKVKAFGYSPEEEQKMLFKVREDILNQLIDQKLTSQEIRQSRITVSGKEIDSTIERIKESNSYTDETLRELLAKEGLTMEGYRERMKEQILRGKLVSLEVKSKVVLTKEDIKAYYEKHGEAYRGGRKYHLRNILMEIPDSADEEQKLEVNRKMEAVLTQLEAGESFEEVAREVSQSSSAAEGGNLGILDEDVLSLQIREAVNALKAGEFTPILDTDLGYQIFFVEEIKQAEGKSLEEASSEIEQKLYNEVVNQKFLSWLEELRKRSHIKIVK